MATQPTLVRPIRKLSYTSSSVVGGQEGNAQFTDIIADTVVVEEHEDEMITTDQPVEQGSLITDHAYKMPALLNLEYIWSAGSDQNPNDSDVFLKTLYQTFLNLEAEATLFKVYTGKRVYFNMLIISLGTVSDPQTENILRLRVSMREIIIATTQLTLLSSASTQAVPQKTAPTVPLGRQSVLPAQNFNTTSVSGGN
jgi:hypothetical protein